MKRKKSTPEIETVNNRAARAHRLIKYHHEQGMDCLQIKGELDKLGFRNKHGSLFSVDCIRGYLYSQKRAQDKRQPTHRLAINDNGRPLKQKLYEKPNVVSLAFSALINGIKQDKDGYYFLKVDGKWHPANLTMIMRAANAVLAKQGKPQIDKNPTWVVT